MTNEDLNERIEWLELAFLDLEGENSALEKRIDEIEGQLEQMRAVQDLVDFDVLKAPTF